jgi:methionine biosynthesis protein MetW
MPSLSERLRILRSLLFDYPEMKLQRIDYDAYWCRREPASVHPRHRLMAEIIQPQTRVLDIGCGDGAFLAHLVESKQVHASGLDISVDAVERARSRGVHAELADITLAEFHLAEVYDYIVLSEVLEHLVNPEDLLLRLKGHARKGILLTIPNTGFWPYRLRLLLGRFPVQWAFHPSEHLRFWTVADFRWWARNLGYRIKGIWATNGSQPFGLRLLDWRPELFAFQVLFWLIEEQEPRRRQPQEPRGSDTA